MGLNTFVQELLTTIVVLQEKPWIWPISKRAHTFAPAIRFWILHARLIATLVLTSEDSSVMLLRMKVFHSFTYESQINLDSSLSSIAIGIWRQ